MITERHRLHSLGTLLYSSLARNKAAPFTFDELKTVYERQRRSQTASQRYESFEEIPSFSPELAARMRRLFGVTRPTPIQGAMLAHYFSSPRSDLLVKARPGTGKTFGYSVLLASEYWARKRMALSVGSLVVVPTRMLARQIQTCYETLIGKERLLEETPDPDICVAEGLVVGTPEALRVRLAQGALDITGMRHVILDEADALLRPLPRHASQARRLARARHPVPASVLLEEVLSLCRQDPLLSRPRLLLSSATLNRLTRDQLVREGVFQNPLFIEDREETKEVPGSSLNAAANVLHYHCLLRNPDSEDEVLRVLESILARHPHGKGLLFVPAGQSKVGLMALLKERGITHRGWSLGLLSNENERDASLLVGSDVDCRGLHLPDRSFVVVLDLPEASERYVHMAGRVGRLCVSNSNDHGSDDSDASSVFKHADGAVYTILGNEEDLSRFTTLTRTQIGITTIPLQTH
jgi:ATP-dependent RNA helicase DeaD